MLLKSCRKSSTFGLFVIANVVLHLERESNALKKKKKDYEK